MLDCTIKKIWNWIIFKNSTIENIKDQKVLTEIFDTSLGKLELLESLEQLRLIDSGFTIDTFKAESYSISVDTEEQLKEACAFASNIEKGS